MTDVPVPLDEGVVPFGFDTVGWDDRWATALEDATGGTDSRWGRVVRTHRVGFDVLMRHEVVFAVTRRRVRDPMAAPATGDWVHIATVRDIKDPVIAAVLPRRTAMVRRDPADRAAPQVLAANADVVAVVQGADRPINPRRLERQLAVAHGSGAEVVVILTKTDLDPLGEADAAIRAAAIGQRVLTTSATTMQHIADVDDFTSRDRTLVLLGESGAGKSSLVNAVLGHEALAVGLVREGDSKGRHTTTRRTLIPLPTGGALLDTPGVRAVGLWPGWVDLDAVFVEIAEAAERCRFANCAHGSEPGCAVTDGVASGQIDPERLAAHAELLAEVQGTSDEVQQKAWR